MNPLSYDGPSVLLLLLLYLVYESYNISTFKVFFMPTKDCQNSGLRTGVAKMFLATSKMLLLQFARGAMSQSYSAAIITKLRISQAI